MIARTFSGARLIRIGIVVGHVADYGRQKWANCEGGRPQEYGVLGPLNSTVGNQNGPLGIYSDGKRPVPAAYFNEVLIEVNLVLRLVPSPFTTAIMASEMPAAISPYSMAVAPDSSAINL
jgi:hypothetical protein